MLSSLARKRSAPSEMLAWLDRVEADTIALLNTLGLSGDEWAKGGTVNRSIKLLPALRHLRAGTVHGAGPFPSGVPSDLRRVFGDARFTQALERAQQNAEQSGKALDPADAFRALGLEATVALLPLTPRVLGLMISLARAIKAIPRRGPRHGGRRPDHIRTALFRRLALVHRDMYGDLPATRNKLGERISDSPSVRWMQGVLALGTERLGQVPDPLMTTGAGRLGKLAKLSGRLSDLIEAGKAASNRRLRGN